MVFCNKDSQAGVSPATTSKTCGAACTLWAGVRTQPHMQQGSWSAQGEQAPQNVTHGHRNHKDERAVSQSHSSLFANRDIGGPA